ncbi:hypothetical protein HYH03_007404 [Edaphochlamys debaryana]|uniref:Sulfotransferase n=1 Tax=Edaphochlamys debaryana TaxID=47281 RepID=A0A835Y366_9CHLO|nr:hypothetical protein HYH03_007404 [Edaphochlamys debaryana]|eukprot:KAG2494347.1 hypothetical protein HYH03_007404 [Edaphochlamys debaryana]
METGRSDGACCSSRSEGAVRHQCLRSRGRRRIGDAEGTAGGARESLIAEVNAGRPAASCQTLHPPNPAAKAPGRRARPALWLLVLAAHAASCSAQASTSFSGERDYYSKLVTLPSNVYGEVKKTGPMPAHRYDDKLFNHTTFRDWLMRGVVLHEDVGPGEAPMSYKCGVFVNHNYKLIFIRNRKAASTTVLDTFKVACKSQSKLLCMRPFDSEEMTKRGLTHDEMWKSYYVISSTRNPWARAASGYDYTQDRWPVKTGVCANIPFRQFCEDPYLMGKMANLFRCGTQSSFRGDDAWAYDFYHVEPAHHCMTDASGSGLSVDFLIRYEHLHQDFAKLLEILNRRRDPELPEIRNTRMRWMKQGVHVQQAKSGASAGSATAGAADGEGPGAAAAGGGAGGAAMWREDAAALVSADRHAVRYRDCGMECVRHVAKFFSKDMEVMKLALPEGAAS